MTFPQSVKTCLGPKYLFKFRGRASRSEFWWFMLFISLINLATGLIFMLMPMAAASSLSLGISLLLLPANFGVTVRRLHDRGMSGWWLLAPLGCLFLAMLFGSQYGIVANAVCLSMSLCYLAILCMPSQDGSNRFGPKPEQSSLFKNEN